MSHTAEARGPLHVPAHKQADLPPPPPTTRTPERLFAALGLELPVPGIKTRSKRDRYFLVERRSLWNRLRRKDIWREERRCAFLDTARGFAAEFARSELLGGEYRVRRTDVVRT